MTRKSLTSFVNPILFEERTFCLKTFICYYLLNCVKKQLDFNRAAVIILK